MPISVLTPDEWDMTPPVGGRGRHLGVTLQEEKPFIRILEEKPNYYTPPHSHSEAEVIVVLEGQLFFNGQWYGPGTIVSVPANEDYWHSTGAERCVIALIRPNDRGKIRFAEEVAAAE
jgi:quercetin dioxygenase-like cupin family protein